MVSALSDERRKYSRISAGLHVAFHTDGDIVTTTTENISFGGMRIVTPRLISPGRVLDFIITLKGRPIDTRGHVVYVSSDKAHAGIQFDKVLHSEWENSFESPEQIGFGNDYISEKIQI
ncbi:MAG: hypothetical protein GTO12_18405 [Proteobacteria bacterium]|nr:hypothetical protein [Pseudomonadota bacterium]